jgi:OOP family OmpA-OmpF porin
MKLRSALLAATVLALPLAAKAQPVTGLYVGGDLGINWMSQENANVNGVTVGGSSASFLGGSHDVSLHPGLRGDLSVGWGFGNGLRLELDLPYMYNSYYSSSSITGTFGPGGATIPGLASAGGHEQKFGGMVNVLYDFTNLSPWIQPYIGAGIGYIGANLQGGSFLVTTGPFNGLQGNLSNGTKGALGYQAILGAAIPIAAMPGLAVTTDFRFLGLAGDRSYAFSGSYRGSPVPVAGTVTFKNDYNYALTVGLRYNFGVAPPPSPAPVAAPAAAPARSYLVFFDWDKATLTARAQQIIKEAADNSTHVHYTRIEVNGYTDTSGTPQYNMGLSIRRAQAVAAELVRDGVPKNVISIQGFGETHLLVPTGPGVREPQNRRVEIIIR